MSLLTLEIDDELAGLLREEASRRNVSEQEIALQGLKEVLRGPSTETKRMIADIIDERRELYKRLA